MIKLARNLSDKTGVVVDHLAQQNLRSDAAKRKTPRLVRALLIESVKSGTRTADRKIRHFPVGQMEHMGVK